MAGALAALAKRLGLPDRPDRSEMVAGLFDMLRTRDRSFRMPTANVRDGASVTELSGMLELSHWSDGIVMGRSRNRQHRRATNRSGVVAPGPGPDPEGLVHR